MNFYHQIFIIAALYYLQMLVYFISKFIYKKKYFELKKEDNKVKVLHGIIKFFLGGLLFYLVIIRLVLGWYIVGSILIPYILYSACFIVLDLVLIGFSFDVQLENNASINFLFYQLKWGKLRKVYLFLRGWYLIIFTFLSFLVYPFMPPFSMPIITMDSGINGIYGKKITFESWFVEKSSFNNLILEFDSNDERAFIYKRRFWFFKKMFANTSFKKYGHIHLFESKPDNPYSESTSNIFETELDSVKLDSYGDIYLHKNREKRNYFITATKHYISIKKSCKKFNTEKVPDTCVIRTYTRDTIVKF